MSTRGAYRGIHTVLLDGPDYQALSPSAKLVLLTLKLTLGPSGIDVLYPAVVEAQTGLPAGGVETALRELEAADWLRRERNVYWVVDGLRHEPSRSLDNRNHRQEITEHLASLPRLPLVAAFQTYYELDRPQALPSAPLPPANGVGHGAPDPVVQTNGDGIPHTIPKHGDGDGGTEKGKRRKGNISSPVADATADAFDIAWKRYPARFGGNPRRAALKQYRARRREGVSADELLAGVERYRAFCEATGKAGTEYVKQASTFFGPNGYYGEPWDVGPAAAALDPLERLAAEQQAQFADDDAWIATRVGR